MRRCIKDLSMMVQTGTKLVGIGRVARQDSITADNAALHFIEPDHAAKLDRFTGLPFADNGRMRFKQTDQLLVRWNALAVEHTALGLAYDLLHARDERGQLVGQSLRVRLTDPL